MTTDEKVLDAIANLGGIKVGDLVAPIPPRILHCGSGIYDMAVCVNLSPFILASVDGDMIWSATVKREEFKTIGRASKSVLIAVNNRIRRTEYDVEELPL